MGNFRVYLLLSIMLLLVTSGFGRRRRDKGISKKIPNNPLRLLPATKYNSKSPRSLSKGIKMTSPSGRKAFPGPGPYYFDYLLGEDNFFKTNADVVFIDYDLDATVITKWKSAGKVVICYVNVGAWEKWRSDASSFPTSVLGQDYDGWPGERWLDITQHSVLLPIMRARFKLASSKGCQGIDPDNMNGYSVKTGFQISPEDQLDYNIAISQEIRALGLLAGMKNDNKQASGLVANFDFAVLEQCSAFDECSYFDIFIQQGKPVFAVEYTDKYDKTSFRKKVCPSVARSRMSFILKNYDLRRNFIVSC